ncbi:DUF559 domain-containing protein [Quadrisphaera sp. KR29]|uniref:DUF559 domain-containing protein n=1 Tax=Quadrisphaera sp. KR29 TaxID=3461391 RepID=UPI004044AB24
MPRQSDFPADLERRPFTVVEALARGVSARVLEGARFRTPHRGVRVPVALAPSRAVDLVAASLALPPHAAFSGWTAVELTGLPTPRTRRDPGAGRITAAAARGAPMRIAGIVCTTGLDPERVRTTWGGRLEDEVLPLLAPGVRGLRVQEPVDVWCELAPGLPRVDGVALGDAVRRHWASEADLDAAVAARDGRPGVVALRARRTEVRWRVDSPMETEVRLLLVDQGLPEPRCGHPLREGGVFYGLVDMAWVAQRVVLEFDGDVHRTERGQWQRDKARRRRLRDAGWTVIEVVADDVRRTPLELVDQVRRALQADRAV